MRQAAAIRMPGVSNSDSDDQNHPLEAIDRDTVDRLLACERPGPQDITDLARLFTRYEMFPGAASLRNDLDRVLTFWAITRDELNSRARKLWSSGFRPGQSGAEDVGSGFDAQQSESP